MKWNERIEHTTATDEMKKSTLISQKEMKDCYE